MEGMEGERLMSPQLISSETSLGDIIPGRIDYMDLNVTVIKQEIDIMRNAKCVNSRWLV